ncbi:putative Adenylate cyclase [Bradyrhizobium sp. ORS 375]|uniref:adenylate/guanylate cyclase domain-containing protein n=1 Tax=Bradyrhizobium sp. (strain ORS 375) TaxID=566679 RepID=UPI0002406F77|nr:adenylate/guanylate cyclase domain-containing protein [Bradyrhizobium sp. ORS 375]CCD95137.1 putative Adenylate cyclase [Bradyrhizobium sp. ORS 375]
MIASPKHAARNATTGDRLTVSIRFAVSALVLTAILLTAFASSLLWWRTAEGVSRQLASTINAQIASAVRKEVSAIVGEARAAHTAIRTLFLQNVLDTREADKREFVFLSQLQSQATISSAAFGWPDGSFFAAHKLGDQRLEMMEISLIDHPGQRRVDEYDVVPGDIEFASRRFEPTSYKVAEQPWFKEGLAADEPRWFKVDIHPGGKRPAIALAGPIDVYQERQGVLAIIIEHARIARFLAQLQVGRTGSAFILEHDGGVVAAPDESADEVTMGQGRQPLLPVAQQAIRSSPKGDDAWRGRVQSGDGAFEIARNPLPFPGWSLVTVIPEAEFLGPVDAALHRVIIGLGIGAVIAALVSAALARSVIAAPLGRVVAELRHVEAFALEQVRRHPSRLREIASLSGAIHEMAGGLSSFGKFIPADLVRQLLRQGVDARPGGHVQELSVMFIDIAGFTGLSERMGDRVVPLLSRYLDLISTVIVDHGGTIDKFIGDAVMAFWGAPSAQPDHAALCCRAALACQAAVAASGLRDEDGRPLMTRIGINSGPMLVGNIGSELRLNYTVIGDAVNVASRLEGANKSYGTAILIGEATARLAGDAFLTREVDRIAVYGRDEGLAAHELIGLAADATSRDRSWVARYARGLRDYRARDFAAAIAAFEAALALKPGDRAAELMIARCRMLMQAEPDPNWHAVTALTTK